MAAFAGADIDSNPFDSGGGGSADHRARLVEFYRCVYILTTEQPDTATTVAI